MPEKKSDKQLRKEHVWDTVQSSVEKFEKCLFVNVDNVTSKQICVMRKALRAMNAKMLMGKNTLIKKALNAWIEEHEGHAKVGAAKLIRDEMMLNTGLIFTNGDLAEVKAVLDSQKREAPAKIGSIAPISVTIPAGPTGLDPKQTSFFQALKIQTKIVKGQVEIVNPVVVINEDDKISAGQSALLDKLKIRPFEFKMHIKAFMDNAKRYDAKVLSITNDSIHTAFSAAAQMLTGLSLGSGYITSAAAPHLVLNAFKNLAAVSMASGYSFPQADKMKAAAAAGPAPAAAGKAEAKAEVKKEESEEEADIDMGNMFGDDY